MNSPDWERGRYLVLRQCVLQFPGVADPERVLVHRDAFIACRRATHEHGQDRRTVNRIVEGMHVGHGPRRTRSGAVGDAEGQVVLDYARRQNIEGDIGAEWRASSPITGVDIGKKQVHTDVDNISFDDAAIYPNVRGAILIEQLGLMAPSSHSNQKEAYIDTRFNNFIGDERVYVTGDSPNQPYSKSANTSNTEAHNVAKVLAARAQGKDPAWVAPETICYSMVKVDPMEAISVDAGYDYDAKKDLITGFSKATKVYNERSAARGVATLEWARGIYRDMFKV